MGDGALATEGRENESGWEMERAERSWRKSLDSERGRGGRLRVIGRGVG